MQTPQTGQTAANLIQNLYEADFYAWTQQQANLLRDQQWHQLDLSNLIEEIESLGRKERQELRNRLGVLIGHLLKWEYQPEQRSRKLVSQRVAGVPPVVATGEPEGLNTVRVQRIDTLELLEENPSLRSYLQEVLPKAYLKAIALASGETNLPLKTFPQDCPYTLEDILSDRFYPGESATDDLME